MVDAVILMQGARVQSLIGELRSHNWYSKKNKRSLTPGSLPRDWGVAPGEWPGLGICKPPPPTPASSLVQLRVRRVVNRMAMS